jgi:hypothetical protein
VVGDGAAVGLDRPADDGEPEAGAAGWASGEADERFEDPFVLIGGDSGSVVGDRYGWAVRCLGDFDHDRVGDRERVVEEVADGAKERVAVAGGGGGTVCDQFDACVWADGVCGGDGLKIEVRCPASVTTRDAPSDEGGCAA